MKKESEKINGCLNCGWYDKDSKLCRYQDEVYKISSPISVVNCDLWTHEVTKESYEVKV